MKNNTDNYIYTNYLLKINIKNADVQITTFEDIFNMIKGGKLKDLVDKIRAESDHAKVQIIKKNNLPIFFPTVLINGGLKNTLNDESTVTGIIQFDIDLKDNLELDIVSLKDEIIKLPETFYVYSSPSNGLKIGIKSDFIKHDKESIAELKARYLSAYSHAEDWLAKKLPHFNIAFDRKVSPLKTACYLSDDKDAYFNQSCTELVLDHLCHVVVKQYKPIKTHQSDFREFKVNSFSFTEAQIKEMLCFIDSDRRYDKRIPINLAVMSVLGSDAIELLVNFWSKTEKDQLKEQLINQLNSLRDGKLTAVVEVFLQAAVKGGYINPFASEYKTGSLRNNLKPVDFDKSTYTLPPLLSAEEASAELKRIVKEFFNDKQSRFINFSTGAGKTQTMLKILEDINPRHRVLYLVKSHALAKEITATFKAIRAERMSTYTNPLDAYRSKSEINHLLGRGDFTNPNKLCENDGFLKSLAKKEDDLDDLIKSGGDIGNYKGGFHPFPSGFCASATNYELKLSIHEIDGVEHIFEDKVKNLLASEPHHETCMYQADCAYVEQFSNSFGNVRVMTHNEFFNLPSKFFSGADADGQPRVNIPLRQNSCRLKF